MSLGETEIILLKAWHSKESGFSESLVCLSKEGGQRSKSITLYPVTHIRGLRDRKS